MYAAETSLRDTMLDIRGFFAARARQIGHGGGRGDPENVVVREVQENVVLPAGVFVGAVVDIIGNTETATCTDDALVALFLTPIADMTSQAESSTSDSVRMALSQNVQSSGSMSASACSTDEVFLRLTCNVRNSLVGAEQAQFDDRRRRAIIDRGKSIQAVVQKSNLRTGHFTDNFVLKRDSRYQSINVTQYNAYYDHPLFRASTRENDRQLAEKSEMFFGYRRVAGYESLELFWSRTCNHCGARFLNTSTYSFRRHCCGPAQNVKFPLWKPLSPRVRRAIEEMPQHFSKCATSYNHLLAFGAIGVDNDSATPGFQHNFRGEHSVTVRGRVYHHTPAQSSSNPNSGLGFMFFDNTDAIAELAREQNNQRGRDGAVVVFEQLVTDLMTDSAVHNALAREVMHIGRWVLNRPLQEQRNLLQTINGSTTYLDIGVLRADNVSGERIVVFHPKGNRSGSSATLGLGNRFMETYTYPMFFTRGEPGWGEDCKPEVHLQQYMMSRILQAGDLMLPSLLDPAVRLPVNRMQAMPRLAQVWMVDMMSRMYDIGLSWVYRNQSLIRGGLSESDEAQVTEEVEADELENKKYHVSLPSSVTGGRRHLAEKAKEALTVVAEKGTATEFLTLTVNHQWREIQEMLLKGQSAFDRTEVVNQVFHEKLNVLLRNLRAGKYHGGHMRYKDSWNAAKQDWDDDTVGEFIPPQLPAGETSVLDYLMVVIEYQHRGLPHAHIVYRVKYAPEGIYRDDSADSARAKEDALVRWIDGYDAPPRILAGEHRIRDVYEGHISARRPGKSTTPRGQCNSDEEAQNFWDDVVGENVLHVCSTSENGCKKDVNTPCKRRFDQFVVNNRTSWDVGENNGKILYRRPKETDLKVVPHSRRMLCDWMGHLNTESVISIFSVLYLYSYLYKGNKKVRAEALEDKEEGAPASSPNDSDEIRMHLNGRLLCAHDACSRALGYETYPQTEPSCKTVTVKTEAQVRFYLKEGLATDVYVYFEAQKIHDLRQRDFTFKDFYKEYYYSYDVPTQGRRNRGAEFCFEIKSPKSDRKLFILKYVKDPVHIVRMKMLYPSAGDSWYLRLILQKRAVKSWKDARSYPPEGEEGSVEYANHQLAARSAGYLVNDILEEGKLCFDEAMLCVDRTPHSLRGLFATLTLEGFVTTSILLEPGAVAYLTEDYVQRQGKTAAQAYKLFLMDLKSRLAKHNKTLEDFGLHCDPRTKVPYKLDHITELDEERDKYDAEAQGDLFNSLEQRYPPNEEQRDAFAAVLEAMEVAKRVGKQQMVCMHGAAGTGKSVIAEKLAAYVRSKGDLVAMCASTTLAATNFKNAHTAHYLFAFPVIEDVEDYDGETPVECQLNEGKFKDRKQYLDNVTLIIWDEVFGNHVKQIEASVRALQHNSTVVWVFIGDTRQILPVIEYGSAQDIIGATFTSSPLWRVVKKVFLKTNLRLRALQESVDENTTSEAREHARMQGVYAQAILEIGEGRPSTDSFIMNIKQEKDQASVINTFALPHVELYRNNEAELDMAVEWLHPGGDLQAEGALRTKTILAVTNECVDAWNTRLQRLNKNKEYRLVSHDTFADVDDPKGHLARLLSEEVLNGYTNTQVPNHVLKLKKGDVCLIMRPMKAYDLASNARVIIMGISENFKMVKVKTLDAHPRIVYVPRMRFNFHLRSKSSYTMSRVQFPLRLCYAMSVNKSQGQSFDQVLLDATTPNFSHGHLYVALSRLREHDKIRVIVNDDMVFEYSTLAVEGLQQAPMMVNVVYPSVIQRPPTNPT